MKTRNERTILMVGWLYLSACNGGGEATQVQAPSVEPVVPTVSQNQDPVVPESNSPPEQPQAPEPEVDDSIAVIHPVPGSSEIQAPSGGAYSVSFQVHNPSGLPVTCYWTRIGRHPSFEEDQVSTWFAGSNKCDSWVYNQNSQVSNEFIVHVSNGQKIASHSWNFIYTSESVNHPVSISLKNNTPDSGDVRVFESMLFQVEVQDPDGDGVCSWKVDGATVSSSCAQYSYSVSADPKTLVFTITDGVHTASKTWVVYPAAKVDVVTPQTAGVAVGASQAFTASLLNPQGVSALCEWKKNGSLAQARGSCSYTYTRENSEVQTIVVDVVYTADGGERNLLPTPKTVYATMPTNQPVSLSSFTPSVADTVWHFSVGATSNVFGVTDWVDPDGDAWFEWYFNSTKVDCNNYAYCTYTNPGLKNGIQIDNYHGAQIHLKVKITDGQYSDEKTWIIRNTHSTINKSILPGNFGQLCYLSGTTFTIHGLGFESTDTFKLMNQNIVLEKVTVGYTMVTLRIPQNTGQGGQAVSVTKNGNTDITGPTWIQLLSGNCN